MKRSGHMSDKDISEKMLWLEKRIAETKDPIHKQELMIAWNYLDWVLNGEMTI